MGRREGFWDTTLRAGNSQSAESEGRVQARADARGLARRWATVRVWDVVGTFTGGALGSSGGVPPRPPIPSPWGSFWVGRSAQRVLFLVPT